MMLPMPLPNTARQSADDEALRTSPPPAELPLYASREMP